MQIQPAADICDDSAPPMLCRIKSAAVWINDPIFFRRAFSLPLQQAFSGESASELNHNFGLVEFFYGFWVAEPKVCARQGLARLREHIANQGPAKSLCPLRRLYTVFCVHAAGDDHAALLTNERPVTLLENFDRSSFLKPRLVIGPPISEALLPAKTGVVHFSVKGLRKRAIDVYSSRMQRSHRVINGRDEPSS